MPPSPPYPPIHSQEQVPLPLLPSLSAVAVYPPCLPGLSLRNKRAAAAASLTPCNVCFVSALYFAKAAAKNGPPSEASITPILMRGKQTRDTRLLSGTTASPRPSFSLPPSLSKLRPQPILRLPLTKPIPPITIPRRLPAALPLILQARLTLGQLIPSGSVVVDAAVFVGKKRRSPAHGAGGAGHGRRGHAKVVDAVVVRGLVVRDGDGLGALEGFDPLVGFALGAFGFFKGVVGAVLVGG